MNEATADHFERQIYSWRIWTVLPTGLYKYHWLRESKMTKKRVT